MSNSKKFQNAVKEIHRTLTVDVKKSIKKDRMYPHIEIKRVLGLLEAAAGYYRALEKESESHLKYASIMEDSSELSRLELDEFESSINRRLSDVRKRLNKETIRSQEEFDPKATVQQRISRADIKDHTYVQ